MKLELIMQTMAVIQAAVAVLNLGLIYILKWKPDIDKMPLLIREVFYIHSWYISLTLLIFATLTWRFSFELSVGEDDVYRWFAGCVAVFWGLRAVLQIAWYSPVHWKGKLFETFVHIALLLTYGAMALGYGRAAVEGKYACIF